MPPIFVWAVVTDARGVLLVPARNANAWALPGGALLPDDESVEAAIVREVAAQFGVSLADEPEFLDTTYERLADGGTLVHNLFHVPGELLGAGLAATDDSEWLPLDDLDRTPVPAWLRRGLGILFGGEEAEPGFDLAQIEAALGRVTVTEPVILVSGPAGAGKSTVARELCRRFPWAAHIEVDELRDMVLSGYASPVPGQSDEAEAEAQNRLATLNAAALARNFSLAGMVAVIDEVLEGSEGLDGYLAALGPDMDVRVVTLLPDVAELARRDDDRPEGHRMGTRSEQLRQIIAANGETRGLRLDTSAWTVEETVDNILERLDEARVSG
jgi:8-oxo-dGTP pyrophosphatase MutT (NUDIX family)/chloramphenicol 3-O-phosphotransferase